MTTTAPPTRTRDRSRSRPEAGGCDRWVSDQVRITSGFWADRQDVNARATLPHIRHWLERQGWLPNFDLAAAGLLPTGRRGREFSDSEVYKYLEAVVLGDRTHRRRRRSKPTCEPSWREWPLPRRQTGT